MIEGGNVTLADESFFLRCVDLKVSFDNFAEIEKYYGEVLAIPFQVDQIKSKLLCRIKNPEEALLWKGLLNNRSSNLSNILHCLYGGSLTFSDMDTQVINLRNDILRVIKKIDAGISKEDAHLIATGMWISENTPYKVIIISDDRDMLSSANIVFSFLGLDVTYRSTYEVLRVAGINVGLHNLFKSQNADDSILDEQNPGKRELINALNVLSRIGQVGFHTSYANRNITVDKLLRSV